MSDQQRTTERNDSALKVVVNTITPVLFFATLVLFIDSDHFNASYKIILCSGIMLSTVFSTIHAAGFTNAKIISPQLKRAKLNALLCLMLNNILLIVHILLLLFE